jgi:uncharacterized protein YbaR (Trm112 family)
MMMNGFLKKYIPILRCPYGHDELTLSIKREDELSIIDGALTCASCERVFPIDEGIPRLLPDELREG